MQHVYDDGGRTAAGYKGKAGDCVLAHATWMLAVVVFASTAAWYALRFGGVR